MKRILIIVASLIFFLPDLNAQIVQASGSQNIQDPTTWTYEVKKLDRNEYELIFHVDMKKGWHIFSQHPGDEMLIPPTFDFNDNGNIRRLGELREKGRLIETKFEGFDNPVKYFEGKVEFIQKISYTGESTAITGEHRYQICNDNMCLPPTSKKFEFITKK